MKLAFACRSILVERQAEGSTLEQKSRTNGSGSLITVWIDDQ